MYSININTKTAVTTKHFSIDSQTINIFGGLLENTSEVQNNLTLSRGMLHLHINPISGEKNIDRRIVWALIGYSTLPDADKKHSSSDHGSHYKVQTACIMQNDTYIFILHSAPITDTGKYIQPIMYQKFEDQFSPEFQNTLDTINYTINSKLVEQSYHLA